MHIRLVNITALVLLISAAAAAQENLYSVAVSSSYTTTAKLFYNPNDPSDYNRSQFSPLDDIFGFGIEVRRTFEGSIVQIGASVEYISKRERFFDTNTSPFVQGYDGFTAFPIEITGYVMIPFNSETANMYIGGGAGAYIGRRNYEYGGVASQTIAQQLGYGIHILTGFEYALRPAVVLLGELKFRDLQFESTNVFSSRAGFTPPYSGPFTSRFSIDGMTMKVALAVRL